MLCIKRTWSSRLSFMDASVVLENNEPAVFDLTPFQKIGRGDSSDGDIILRPANHFLASLTPEEQHRLLAMYRQSVVMINIIQKENLTAYITELAEIIKSALDTIDHFFGRLITFCQKDEFEYPDLTLAGSMEHHVKDKTFLLNDYVQVTALSVLNQMLLPIFSEVLTKLSTLRIQKDDPVELVLDILEDVVDKGPLDRIYTKLTNTFIDKVDVMMVKYDKRVKSRGMTSGTVLQAHQLDRQRFADIVCAIVVVKRLTTYKSVLDENGIDGVPNVMVYLSDGVARTVDTKLASFKNAMT